jgi:antitoxin (DNA-binding transcriptional repressor) of toxin-antitoxin stability system
MSALAPCGTFTAYKRHKRNGEPVDEACAQAARDQKNARAEAKRDELAEVHRLAIVEAGPEPEGVDELAEARLNLSIVRAAMQAGVPTGLAALSKQYADLVALVKRLENQSRPEVSALDQLAQRRADRLAASSH